MTTAEAVAKIVAERERQKTIGYNEEHDKEHGLLYVYDKIYPVLNRGAYPDTFIKVAAMCLAALELES